MSKRNYTVLRPRQSFLRCRHRAQFDCIGQTVMRCRIRSQGETRGAACVSINFTTVSHPFYPYPPSPLHPFPLFVSYIHAVHSAVLQIKPACTSLIEQNFNSGSTRNQAPWVTKHRVNTMVHRTGSRCKRARLVGGNREGTSGKELCVWIFVEM